MFCESLILASYQICEYWGLPNLRVLVKIKFLQTILMNLHAISITASYFPNFSIYFLPFSQ